MTPEADQVHRMSNPIKDTNIEVASCIIKKARRVLFVCVCLIQIVPFSIINQQFKTKSAFTLLLYYADNI
jgi:hypothetical protein